MNANRLVKTLADLYAAYGYQPYRMSKFEEYDLYARNKDFLLSDQIITFTDTNGKLLALKPDVTLSIIKNTEDLPGVQKLSYHENVYRVSGHTGAFREQPQTGLECIGELGPYDIAEVLLLAGRSLKAISEEAVLDISDLGLLSKVLDAVTAEKADRREVLRCFYEKNRHELSALCRERFPAAEETLDRLIQCQGAPREALEQLRDILGGTSAESELRSLEKVMSLLEGTDVYRMLRLDLSVSGDSKYYNGIVFKGYVKGVPNSVLTGGRYDNLLRRFHRASGAVGFAVYLDMLEPLYDGLPETDVDDLIVCPEEADLPAAIRLRDRLIGEGKRVSVQRLAPGKLRCKNRWLCKGNEVTPF